MKEERRVDILYDSPTSVAQLFVDIIERNNGKNDLRILTKLLAISW